MLNLFQHPWDERAEQRACWHMRAMDAEPQTGAAKQVQHDE
jgi:hypothetical protein